MKNEKIISNWINSFILTQEGKSTEKKKEILNNLVKILKRQKKEHLLPKILEGIRVAYLRKKRVGLILAREQSPETVNKLKKRLLNIFGQDKEFEVSVEKSLIGGFRAKTEKLLVRASVKDFLNELKK